MGRYMHGLALTQYLWPNHLQLYRFAVETLPKHRTGRYLEVGPGHGLFMIAAMRLSSYDEFVGVDLSETSIELTRAVLQHPAYGPFSNYRLEHVDFLGSAIEGPFDAIVMGEVLEHVEEPRKFLDAARKLLAPSGYFYMSTALNSGVLDHIYLFRSLREVEDLVREAGFTIEHSLAAPHAGTTLEQCEAEGLPVSVAYALT
jgi:2-polyprenyl-3-methyl-5-hydroxy-6-metoxy-1,4-benzoquinol methylase